MRTKEYDNFGPWIQEINNIDDIPTLFIPYCSRIEDALFLIKIPRNIDRHNANPTMDLYDYILGVYDDYMLILKRDAKSVQIFEIKFRDIIAIKESIELLHGAVSFYLPGRIITFNYNLVSIELIRKLLKLLREKSVGNVFFANNEVSDYDTIEGIDDLYKILIKSFMMGNDQFKVLAIQPSIKAIPKYVTVLKKTIDWFCTFRVDMLQNSMYLTNKKELLIVTREKAFKRSKAVPYGYNLTYIPLVVIKKVESSLSSNYINISPLLIETQYHTFQYYFENLNIQKENVSKMCMSI